MRAGETNSAGAGRIVHLLFGIAVAAGFMLPIAWLVAGSLRPGSEIFTSLDPLSIGSFVPSRPTLENFGSALAGSFRTGLINSFVVAACTVVVALLVCATAAFALSAMQWRGRDVVFALIVFSFLIPEEVVAIPLSAIFARGGLQNTYIALIVPFVGSGMVIFLLRQFFLAIPRSLIEAAQIDGAGWLRIFLEIFLPLSRPALIAAGVIIFNGQWQAYLWPLLVTTRQDMFLAPITLALMAGEHTTDYGQIFAASTILSLIPAVILLGFQRFFTDSVSMSSVKE
ncbi:MAG: ABC transporter permease subunit [Mesorhizobium sp.]|uniref:carbohydrate ABC transporter permease n=1 Tax=unclassified Mesorhizobium TaxID=325217 RepID=UPI000FCA464B|nr:MULTISPECIES: carbohydrate ABC transporter permease [unclassified Mesorhizobium]RUV63536.1 carbohydrate ABC transporter permease [Mesorhizobium sp. M5C.F.Ca.IN.020.29.1.1]RWA95071.1 MAG: carbohydrate ABC transporter permease [Mesorhizobium sp.]RWC17726.1 MAG: carbohydrate ABC transporter permease [Mesorhizobium sp.]RWD73704.1 MAG: carbohydrate ABC transporter permease [Mesorhizobium sp.]RWE51687.1 MAG: carbohydrate ABC transporter permease [Mesorhizobium sp.]